MARNSRTKGKITPAVRRYFKKRNADFKKMNKARRRITIARDVIAQLDAEKLRASPGLYLSWSNKWRYTSTGLASVPLHEAILDEKCDVCGVGALLVTAVSRANECTASDVSWDSDNIFKYLERFFSTEQLVMIETAFEGCLIDERDICLEGALKDRCVKFYKKADRDPQELLRLIMQNIVDNGGEFVP